MTRILLALACLCLSVLAGATEVTTPLAYGARQSTTNNWMNNATQITLSSTEQNVVISVDQGYPVLVQFAPPASGANSWTYSTVSGQSTQQTTVAAGQAVNLWFDRTTTVYLTSSAGVTISISCLKYEIQRNP